MGHNANPDREYQLLQQRLDRNVTGAPDSPALIQILKLLCTPEEAAIARRVPTRFTTLHALAKKLKKPEQELDDILTGLAYRGLVIDLEYNGDRYFTLAPVVIGFFEFIFMRTSDTLPQSELAQLFDDYMFQDDRFAHAVFSEHTQIGRAMVREETLPTDTYTEILDWERASHAIRSAETIGVSLCSCRHKASHLGEACDRPQETCLSFGIGAASLIQKGFARAISQAEALDILALSKEHGLMQTGDNVKHNLTYLCNCCGCCCSMIKAIKTYDIHNAIVTSNWIAEVNPANCVGCGQCVTACPVGALMLQSAEATEETEGQPKRWAIRDAELCLGCGVCAATCPTGAITMHPREQHVYVPETTFDRMIAMAIERGKLAHLLFEDPDLLHHRALGRIVNVLENTPPVKALLAIEPLRSTFLTVAVQGAKLLTGHISESLT